MSSGIRDADLEAGSELANNAMNVLNQHNTVPTGRNDAPESIESANLKAGGSEMHYTVPKLLERVRNFETDLAIPASKSRALHRIYQSISTTPKHSTWQDSHLSQASRLAHLHDSQENSDVKFIVGHDFTQNPETVSAHRFVLSLASPIFENMFSNNWLESNQQSDPIVIPDVEPLAFKRLVKFAYTDSVALDADNVMAILFAANKYCMRSLEYLCIEFLGDSLNSKNAIFLLDQARKWDITLLADLCLATIDVDTVEAFTMENLVDVSLDTIKTLLPRDTLKIDELSLFKIVLECVKTECTRQNLPQTPENMRQILGPSIYDLRFPAMGAIEFSEEVAPTQLLSDADMVTIFRHLILPHRKKPAIPFKAQPRLGAIMSDEIIINRFQRIESRWGYSGTADRVKFQVDTPIFLKGFGLFGSMNQSYEYNVSIEVIECSTNTVLGSAERQIVTNGTVDTYRALFDEPLDIVPNVVYTAVVLMRGPDSYYGSKGLRRVVKETANGMINFQFAYAPGNNNGTSVDDGQIPEFVFCMRPYGY
uniref:BTB domain-containing protein n=1 Tax=Panagrellus redivivus TaxID=6233 RepID=A0A7E4W084_PANRE